MAEKISSHQEAINISKELHEIGKENQQRLKEEGRLHSFITGEMFSQRDIAKVLTIFEHFGELCRRVKHLVM